MKLLVDNSISRRVTKELAAAGHDCIHVQDLGLESAGDDNVIAVAVAEERTILTQDWMLPDRFRREAKPSVITLQDFFSPIEQQKVLLANADSLTEKVFSGSLAIFLREHLLFLTLPLGKGRRVIIDD